MREQNRLKEGGGQLRRERGREGESKGVCVAVQGGGADAVGALYDVGCFRGFKSLVQDGNEQEQKQESRGVMRGRAGQGMPGMDGPRGPKGIYKIIDAHKRCKEIGGKMYKGVCLKSSVRSSSLQRCPQYRSRAQRPAKNAVLKFCAPPSWPAFSCLCASGSLSFSLSLSLRHVAVTRRGLTGAGARADAEHERGRRAPGLPVVHPAHDVVLHRHPPHREPLQDRPIHVSALSYPSQNTSGLARKLRHGAVLQR